MNANGIRVAAIFVNKFSEAKFNSHLPSSSSINVFEIFLKKGINQKEDINKETPAEIINLNFSFLFFIRKNPIRNIEARTAS